MRSQASGAAALFLERVPPTILSPKTVGRPSRQVEKRCLPCFPTTDALCPFSC